MIRIHRILEISLAGKGYLSVKPAETKEVLDRIEIPFMGVPEFLDDKNFVGVDLPGIFSTQASKKVIIIPGEYTLRDKEKLTDNLHQIVFSTPLLFISKSRSFSHQLTLS